MDIIFLGILIAWIIVKLLKWSTSGNSGGLNDIEKYKTFENIRKKK